MGLLVRLYKSLRAIGYLMEMKPIDEDLRHFEFLAINSKEIIEKQVDSYRQQHSYAGTIIGFTVLFIPFILNSLDDTNQILQFISILPIALFIGAILLMLSMVVTSMVVGKRLLAKFFKITDNAYLSITVGVVVLKLISIIPVIGWLVYFVGFLYGLGKIFKLIIDNRKD